MHLIRLMLIPLLMFAFAAQTVAGMSMGERKHCDIQAHQSHTYDGHAFVAAGPCTSERSHHHQALGQCALCLACAGAMAFNSTALSLPFRQDQTLFEGVLNLFSVVLDTPEKPPRFILA